MRFKYTFSLNRKTIENADVNQVITDFATHINVNDFDEESFARNAVRRRHLREAPILFAQSEGQGTGIFSGVLNKAGTWNITSLTIKHSQATYAVIGKPPLFLEGMYEANDFEVGVYEIGLMYSTNNGASYTLIPNTNRYLGYLKSGAPLWTGKTTHYMTKAPNSWWSHTMASHRQCFTQTGLKHISPEIPLQTITHYALGIRTTAGTKDVHELDNAFIRLIGKDST